MLRRNTLERKWRALAHVAAIGAAGTFVPGLAHAHFILVTPDSWMSQDSSGGPQKIGPCGNEGGGTASGKVTALQPGQTITITVNETVFHPGHYRVALSVNDRSELPPEPIVTPTGSDQCASAAIENPPAFPILADNMLVHTAPFGGPQSFQVTIPDNVSCTKCTLQILEFMSSHGAPCFYHHCADISIQDDGGADSSNVPDGASGVAPPPADDGGGCAIAPRTPSGLLGFAGPLVLAALVHRRGRRSIRRRARSHVRP